MTKQKFTLSKPIQVHGDEIIELSVREPLGADIRVCGMPMTFSQAVDGQQKIDMNTQVLAMYMARLCDIPPSSVDQLSLSDFARLMELIAGFFGTVPPA